MVAVVAAFRQELSVGLMYARTGMLRDAVERCLDDFLHTHKYASVLLFY